MAVRDYIARPARHRPLPHEGHLLRRGQAGGGQQDQGRARPEPARRDQGPRVGRSVLRRRARGRPASARGGPRSPPADALGPGRNAGPRWPYHSAEVMGHAAAARAVPIPRGRAVPPRQGPGGEPLCFRGDREALPAAGVRRGPAHRAAPRRGRRRGPGGLRARLAGPRRFDLGAAVRALDLPHRREPGGQPRPLAAGARGGAARGPRREPAPAPAPSRACSTRRRRGCSTRPWPSSPPSSAPCFVLRAVEEMSYKEIAEALGSARARS